MGNRCVAWLCSILLVALCATHAHAQQTIDLGVKGPDVRWLGVTADARAGAVLDHGTMNSDSRRDLIVGAPGRAAGGAPTGQLGRVYILLGGRPDSTGDVPLSTADVVLTGGAADDRFGAAVAAGNILNVDGVDPRNLVVGAPEADGGRGAVYVFAAGFAHGASLTAADAVVTLRGAVGDRLGSALATADLDGDGYREVVAGAPGNSRVYVVYGGPALSGTRDLSSSAADGADVVITGSGIGGVLAAGPLSGPQMSTPPAPHAPLSVYDVFIGAPSLNLIYMIEGPGSRSLPRNMVVSRDETAYFSGVGADGTGTSLRVGDLDGREGSDLFIGAPTAGPANTGAVYVLWGSEGTLASRNLASADVTLVGPAEGARFGQFVASGDINRDAPDDLAISAPGFADGGRGAVLVYYGRERYEIGTVQANGTRRVQMGGASPESNLTILADPAGGGVSTVFVYEVTGDGARDIIIGSPEAASVAGASSGSVYYVMSPTIMVPASPASAIVVQGGSGHGALSVVNPSMTRITYRVQSNTAWLTPVPAEGSTVDGAPGSLNLLASAASLAPGDYVGNATVVSTSEHLEMWVPVRLNLTVISAPRLTANVALPAMAGTTITWTATARGGAAGLLYQFWRHDPGVGWHLVQDYSTSNTYTWTPTRHDAGEHTLQVWVKTPQSTERYDAYTGTSFAIQRSVATITAFTTNGAYPVAPNTPVTVSAKATGGSAALEYQFWVYRAGSGWSILQAYSPSATATWTPAAPGSYALQVWVRSQGITDNYEAWRGTEFLTVSDTDPITIQSFVATPALPAKAGAAVTFTATATGGSSGPLQYQFWRYDAGVGWSLVQDYSSNRSYSWTPGTGDLGDHAVQVWVRSSGSSAAQEAWQTTGIFRVTSDPLGPLTLTSDVAFPVPAQTPVKWTARVSGGIAPLQYQFWVYREGVGWTMARDYDASNTFAWTPPAAGRYAVQAWVRNAGSTAAQDAWTTSGLFTIGSSGPAAVRSITTDRSLPVAAGTVVTWTAQGTGGTAGPLEYRFWRYSGTTNSWTIVQDYSSNNTFSWTVQNSDTGTFAIQVWVRSAGSTANYEGWATTGYFSVR